MTVALLSQWGSQPPGTLYTSDAATEAAMIARGQATATLTGAVTWSGFLGPWRSFPNVTMRLRMTGTGTVTMDARNAAGVITSAVYTASLAGVTLVDYAYPGDDADSIRITLTGTATAEVI